MLGSNNCDKRAYPLRGPNPTASVYHHRDGLFDVKTKIEYFSDSPLHMWIKYKDTIVETRERIQNPEYFSGIEYFAEEISKYRKKHGITPVGKLIRPTNR